MRRRPRPVRPPGDGPAGPSRGRHPRLLLLSVADDPTATVAPPELVREACEAAVAEGLHVISDETWRDTLHHPHDTVLLSPAEMCPDDVTVVSDLGGALTPAAWPCAVARFPPTDPSRADRWTDRRARVLDVLTALGAVVPGPVAPAAAHALDEPEDVTVRARRAATVHGRLAGAAHRTALAAGLLARPPQAGRHLYADLGPLRAGLAARGVTDSLELESHLTARLGAPAAGGHRFGDELGALRVRFGTGMFLGVTEEERDEALRARDPVELPHVARALEDFGGALEELR